MRGRFNAKVTIGVTIVCPARDWIGDVVVGTRMARLSVGPDVFSSTEHLDFGKAQHSF